MTDLLTADTVVDYLVGRRILEPGSATQVTELGGGVSNVVLSVRTPHLRVVVKQSLPKLRVADEWLAKRERAITEADVLRLASELTPRAVPDVLDVDPDACALVVDEAPEGWRDWKSELLGGWVDRGVASEVGRILGVWHRETADPDRYGTRFGDHEAFDQLRVDPYYRTVIARRPELAGEVGRLADEMVRSRTCLVHGDYSPKNVLTGDGRVWIIDAEVAHFGDPAFDVAFMTNHLLLKAIHRPSSTGAYRDACQAFWASYHLERPPSRETPYVLGHVGCLMAARVDGKSPAEYLTAAGRDRARAFSAHLLSDPAEDLDQVWSALEEHAWHP